MRFIFTDLPMPPSVNKAYVSVGHRRVKSAQLVTFNRQMDLWGLSHVKELRAVNEALKLAKIDLHLIFYFPVQKIYTKAGKAKQLDVSNRIKGIEDAFCRLIEIDDCNIFMVRATKRVGTCEKVYLELKEYQAHAV